MKQEFHGLANLVLYTKNNRQFASFTAACEDEGLCRMHRNGPDVVRVRLEHVQSLQSVVVEGSYCHVIGTGDDPVLPGHETCGTNGEVAHLEDDKLQ